MDLERGRRGQGHASGREENACLPEVVVENTAMFKCGFGCLIFLIGLIIFCTSIVVLGPEEQLILTTDDGLGKKVTNGPGFMLVSPGQDREKRKALRLSPQQYAAVKLERDGVVTHTPGPMLLFLGPWDELIEIRKKTVLEAREYLRLVNTYTGTVRVEEGPKWIVPDPFEVTPEGIQKAFPVRSQDMLVILNKTSGKTHTFQQEGFFVPKPFEEVVETRQATVLREMDYAVVQNSLTGRYRHEVGPKLLFVDSYDTVVAVRPKIVLKKQQYVRLVDKLTGYARVALGPDLIVPSPTEDGPGGIEHSVEPAIVVTSQTSVILLNRTSGRKYEHRQKGMFTPGPYEDVLEVREAVVLKAQEYAVIQDELTGKFLHYAGPQQLFVGAYERLVRKLPKIVLQNQQYVQLVDRRTGEETVVKGPQTIVPEPEQCEKDYSEDCQLKAQQAIVMKADVSVLTLNKTSGERIVRRADSQSGGIFTPAPYEEILDVRKATVLKQQEYAVVKNNRDGSFRHAEGPELLMLTAYEELVSVHLKVVLAKFEYIRLVDEISGVERVVEGPLVLVPEPTEISIVGDDSTKEHTHMVQHATLVDKDQALLVVNYATGKQTLVTEAGMWTPAPYERVIEKRPVIRVLANEAIVVRDFEGHLTVHDGTVSGAGTTFFLQPRSAIASMTWTEYLQPDESGQQASQTKLVEKIDMRIQRTYYSFQVRTNDNVRLLLMGTIFWRVADVTKMVLGTSDPSGDVWQHCRSSFMQSVSKTTFEDFMGSFNTLAKDAFERDTEGDFYSKRGVELLSMEVTRFEAVDEETKATLQRINDETTNQITLLKQQEGDNSVRSAKMRADILLEKEQTEAQLELENDKTDLIRLRSENKLKEQRTEAEVEAQPFAQHAKSFLQELVDSDVPLEQAEQLYKVLQTADYHNTDTKNLANGGASLILTSKDVNLNLQKLNAGTNAFLTGSDP